MAMDLQPDVTTGAEGTDDADAPKKKGKLPIPAALTPTRWPKCPPRQASAPWALTVR